MLAQRPLDSRRLDRAAAEREHGRALVVQRGHRRLGLEHAELDLPSLLEDLRDRPPDRPLELAVEVNEPASEPVGYLGAQLRLARPHEADERDVPF